MIFCLLFTLGSVGSACPGQCLPDPALLGDEGAEVHGAWWGRPGWEGRPSYHTCSYLLLRALGAFSLGPWGVLGRGVWPRLKMERKSLGLLDTRRSRGSWREGVHLQGLVLHGMVLKVPLVSMCLRCGPLCCFEYLSSDGYTN